jgi:hypothetical protein
LLFRPQFPPEGPFEKQKAVPISILLIETAFIHTHDSKGTASCVTPEKHYIEVIRLKVED